MRFLVGLCALALFLTVPRHSLACEDGNARTAERAAVLAFHDLTIAWRMYVDSEKAWAAKLMATPETAAERNKSLARLEMIKGAAGHLDVVKDWFLTALDGRHEFTGQNCTRVRDALRDATDRFADVLKGQRASGVPDDVGASKFVLEAFLYLQQMYPTLRGCGPISDEALSAPTCRGLFPRRQKPPARQLQP